MAGEIQTPEQQVDAAAPPADAIPTPTLINARFDRTDRRSFAVAAALLMVGYCLTLPPSVTLEWSGMLSTTAKYAGVGPPAGYPLWTLYSWVFIHLLPFSNIAWRVAVGSAVATSVACGLAAMMVSYSGRILVAGLPAFSRLNPREQNLLRMVGGCVAGAVLGFSGMVWNQAVIVETRGLGLLLFVGILVLLMRWFFEQGRKRFLYGAFLLLGLLLTNNQEMIVALPGLVCAVMLADEKIGRDVSLFALPLAALATVYNQYNLIWTVFLKEMNWPMLTAFVAVVLAGIALGVKTRRVGTEWKSALACGLCLLLGLALYFYEAIASMTNPPVNWGYPRTVEGFLHVISRGQYQNLLPTDDFLSYAQQLWTFLLILGKGFGWLYLILAALPFAFVRRFDPVGRRWVFALLGVFLCVGLLRLALLNPSRDRSAWEMIKVYFGPACAVLAVCFGLGLIILGARMTRQPERTGA